MQMFCISEWMKVVQSCPTFCDPMKNSWNSPGQNTGVGSLSLLQGIFLTQGSNPGLPHCRQILYQMSHKGSPRILEQVAYPFSSRSSQTRNQTQVSSIAGEFFTNWAIREKRITFLRSLLPDPLLNKTKTLWGRIKLYKINFLWF